jgi:hypothetical protein
VCFTLSTHLVQNQLFGLFLRQVAHLKVHFCIKLGTRALIPSE